MPDTNSLTLEVLVKAGSIYETRESNGISHFLEHMFFKGGKKYKTPKDVAQAVDSFGGESNAYTSSEYAGYYIKSAPEFIDKSIDILSDMLMSPTFEKEEMEREKGVVLQEIMMYEDMPNRQVWDKFNRYYFGDNSFGWATLGTAENVQSFTQQNLFDHKDGLYTKDNLLIVVAGKIENEDKILELISTKFNDLPTTKSIETPKLDLVLPSKKMEFYDKETQQNHLVLGAGGYNISDHKKYAASLLGTLLGGNMSSRLYQEIREKRGLCYYVGSAHFASSQDGLFMVRAGLQKDKFDEGVEAILEHLQKVCEGDLTEKEFKDSLGYINGQTKMGIETSDSMSSFLGKQYLINNEIKTLDEVLAEFNKLSLDDVKEVAKKLSRDLVYGFCIR